MYTISTHRLEDQALAVVDEVFVGIPLTAAERAAIAKSIVDIANSQGHIGGLQHFAWLIRMVSGVDTLAP